MIAFFSSSRYVARTQLDALKDLSFGLCSRFDIEFAVFEKISRKTQMSSYTSDSASQNLSVLELNNIGLPVQLHAAGIKVKKVRAGKTHDLFEIPTKYDVGIDAADNVFRAKHFIKEIINQYCVDQQAVFMTKPSLDTSVCGQAFKHSIYVLNTIDIGFLDCKETDGISQVARYWLAGLVKHARGLTALCSPTANCYRRLHGPSAPCKASVSTDDNDWTYSFRLKYAGTADTFVENRLPGGSANPYIVLAATVAAGLAGIKHKYPRPDPDVEILLPTNLPEALDALEEDQELVKALGEEFIHSFIRNKREFEVDVLKEGLTDDSIEKERNMYMKLF